MKVILLRDVAKLGRRSDVVEVPDGYGRNQLIPKGVAEIASPANLKKIEKQNAVAAAGHKAAEKHFAEALAKLNDQVLKVPAEMNEQGHAFKAINEAEIVAIAEQSGIAISPDMVKIKSPIKTAGEHTVILAEAGNEAEFKIEIIKK